MKRKLVWLILVAAVAAGSWGLWKWRHRAPKETVRLATIKVERGNLRASVASSGRVVPNQEVEVKCKAGGQVVKMPCDISDAVKAGDLLVELDPVDEQRKVKQAEAELAASQARLLSAKENLTLAEMTLKTDRQRAQSSLKAAESHAMDARQKAARIRQLLTQKLVSQEECDTADTQADQATADLEAAQVRIEELKTAERALELKRQDVALAQATVDGDQITLAIAQDRLRDTRVLSPIDGVVATRQVEPGQIIASATSNVGGGTTLLTLCDLSRVFVVATVDETDIGKVQMGQQASISADAFPRHRFAGEVQRVAVQGVNTSNVVTFEVRIEVNGRDKGRLKPEMTANVEIITAQKDDVLTLPVEAVTRKGREYQADKVTGLGTNTTVPVTVGLADNARIEIVSGLAEGDEVAYRKGGDDASKWGNRQPQGGPPRGMMMPMGPPPGARGGR